jgi:predicted TIM-barrel fold metal-dependent hydrolase
VLGAHRVMLGTDHPLNVGPELAKYRALGLMQQQLDEVPGGTAERVFNLPS